MNEENQIRFFDDIYGYDAALEKALAACPWRIVNLPGIRRVSVPCQDTEKRDLVILFVHLIWVVVVLVGFAAFPRKGSDALEHLWRNLRASLKL